MKKFNSSIHIFIGCLILLPLVIESCKKKKDPESLLHEVIEQKGYLPIKLPRDFDGVGTIYTFVNGREIPISGPEDCFKGLEVTEGDVQFPEITKKTDVNLDINAGVKYMKGAIDDASLALTKEGVQNVNIKFGSTKVFTTKPIKIERYLRDTPLDSTCTKRFTKKQYEIIYEVLAANDLEFSFYKNASTRAKISISLIKQLGLDLNKASISNDSTKLTINKALYIGLKSLPMIEYLGSYTGEKAFRVGEQSKIIELKRMREASKSK